MSENFDIGRRLTGISNKIRHIFDASFAGSDITGTQASILHYIVKTSQSRNVFQRDIEAEFYIRRSSVTSVLHGLEKSGYIRRESVPDDARLKKIVLTDKAMQITVNATALFEKINDLLLKGFSKEEAAYMEGLLKRIVDNLP